MHLHLLVVTFSASFVYDSHMQFASQCQLNCSHHLACKRFHREKFEDEIVCISTTACATAISKAGIFSLCSTYTMSVEYALSSLVPGSPEPEDEALCIL